jgi:hypothetical protein
MIRVRLAAALGASLVTLAASASTAGAQGLAARLDAAQAGHVQFTFAALPGICGNVRK